MKKPIISQEFNTEETPEEVVRLIEEGHQLHNKKCW